MNYTDWSIALDNLSVKLHEMRKRLNNQLATNLSTIIGIDLGYTDVSRNYGYSISEIDTDVANKLVDSGYMLPVLYFSDDICAGVEVGADEIGRQTHPVSGHWLSDRKWNDSTHYILRPTDKWKAAQLEARKIGVDGLVDRFDLLVGQQQNGDWVLFEDLFGEDL